MLTPDHYWILDHMSSRRLLEVLEEHRSWPEEEQVTLQYSGVYRNFPLWSLKCALQEREEEEAWGSRER